MEANRIIHGHVLDALKTIPDSTIQCCITSPPYFGLRAYDVHDQVWGGNPSCTHKFNENDSTCDHCNAWNGSLGMEEIPDCLSWARHEDPCSSCFVCHLRAVFEEVRRVLKDNGTLWLNLGDSYAGSGKGRLKDGTASGGSIQTGNKGSMSGIIFKDKSCNERTRLKPKDLIGIPWRTALALQSDGWTLRNEIIWHKLAPMPESVNDRCTRSHEHIFLMSKSREYLYNSDAVAEKATSINTPGQNMTDTRLMYGNQNGGNSGLLDLRRRYNEYGLPDTRNRRTVWTISHRGEGAIDGHFASYPEELVQIPILAGTNEGDIVLDPFFGSGTTGLVALKAKRRYIGIELSEKYAAIAKQRLEPEEHQLKLM